MRYSKRIVWIQRDIAPRIQRRGPRRVDCGVGCRVCSAVGWRVWPSVRPRRLPTVSIPKYLTVLAYYAAWHNVRRRRKETVTVTFRRAQQALQLSVILCVTRVVSSLPHAAVRSR